MVAIEVCHNSPKVIVLDCVKCLFKVDEIVEEIMLILCFIIRMRQLNIF